MLNRTRVFSWLAALAALVASACSQSDLGGSGGSGSGGSGSGGSGGDSGSGCVACDPSLECHCAEEGACQFTTPMHGGIKEYASCDRTLYIYQPGDWEAQTRSYVLVKTSTQEVVGIGYSSDVPVCPNGNNVWFAGEPIKYDSGPPGCGTSSCQAFGVWQGCP